MSWLVKGYSQKIGLHSMSCIPNRWFPINPFLLSRYVFKSHCFDRSKSIALYALPYCQWVQSSSKYTLNMFFNYIPWIIQADFRDLGPYKHKQGSTRSITDLARLCFYMPCLFRLLSDENKTKWSYEHILIVTKADILNHVCKCKQNRQFAVPLSLSYGQNVYLYLAGMHFL